MIASSGIRNIFIGRQPIYARALQLYAYELLYRSGEENSAGLPDGDAATSQVILNPFTEIGIENLVGQHFAFINLPLGPVVVGALLNHEDQAGQALHCTLAYQQNEWDQIDCSRMEKSVIVQSYLDAVAWADRAMKELI